MGKGKGNPWHDSQGRFCSGPSGGKDCHLDSADVERTNLNEGESYYVKENTGGEYCFVFESKDEGIIKKTENGVEVSFPFREDYTSVSEFNMSYDEFKEMVNISRAKRDKNGDVCWDFDGETIYSYENDDSVGKEISMLVYTENDDESRTPCTLNVTQNEDGEIVATVESYPPYNETLDEWNVFPTTIRRADDGSIVFENDADIMTISKDNSQYKEYEKYVRIFELIDGDRWIGYYRDKAGNKKTFEEITKNK